MIQKIKQNKLSVIIIAIIAIALVIITRDRYTALIVCTMGIYIIAVSGLDILFGYSGQISFGHAAYYLVGAYTSAILSTKFGVSPWLGLILGPIAAMLAGFIIAVPASKLVRAFLSFMTIAFANVLYNIVINLEITGRHNGIRNIPPLSFFGYKLNTRPDYFFIVAILVVIMLIVKNRIVHSRTGRAFISMKDSTVASAGSGVNIKKYKIMAFGVSAFYTGLAGALYAHCVFYISPNTFTPAQSTLFMTMLLFGGMGTMVGPIIGSVLLVLIQPLLQAFTIYQEMIYALVILLVLFLMPNGLQGLYYILKNKLFKGKEEGSAGEVDTSVKN